MNVRCPACGTKFALAVARADADWQAYLEVRATLPPAIHRALDEYLELFRPAKTGLRPSRMRRLTEELAPMIREGAITRAGHTYPVPLSRFIAALEYLCDTPPKTMTLPLGSHGYLLSMLAKQAEQAEARAEQQIEHQRRQQTRARTAGRPVPLAETLAKASAPIDRAQGPEGSGGGEGGAEAMKDRILIWLPEIVLGVSLALALIAIGGAA